MHGAPLGFWADVQGTAAMTHQNVDYAWGNLPGCISQSAPGAPGGGGGGGMRTE